MYLESQREEKYKRTKEMSKQWISNSKLITRNKLQIQETLKTQNRKTKQTNEEDKS